MQTEKVGEMYESHKNLIEKRANYYEKRMGTDKEELMSQGKIAFLKCVKAHRKKQTAFNTLLWPYLKNSMFNLSKQNIIHRNRFKNFSLFEEGNATNGNAKNNGHDFDPLAKQDPSEFQIPEDLSKQASEAIQIILDNQITHLGQLTEILIKRGYKTNPNNYIQSIYREIRQTIDKGKRRKTNH